jgi:hypothetical protein
MEGDLITFASTNLVTAGAIPVKYNWTVSPNNLNVTSGLGTSSITVDTKGLGGQTITADLDVKRRRLRRGLPSENFRSDRCRKTAAAARDRAVSTNSSRVL